MPGVFVCAYVCVFVLALVKCVVLYWFVLGIFRVFVQHFFFFFRFQPLLLRGAL